MYDVAQVEPAGAASERVIGMIQKAVGAAADCAAGHGGLWHCGMTVA